MVVVLGGRGARESALSHGLAPHTVLAPPFGRPDLARFALRRLAVGARRIVCWSDELARSAARLSRRVELVSTSPGACNAPARRLARVVCLTEHDAEQWRDRGASPEVESSLMPNPRSWPSADRQEVRALLGLDASVLLFAPLADAPHHADARGLAFLLTLLHTAGYPVCGIVPSAAASIVAARRHRRGVGSAYRLLVTDRLLTDILPAVDIAVQPGTPRTGSEVLLDALARMAGAEVVRLSHRGRAGLSSTPGAAAPILDRLDTMLAARGVPAVLHSPRPEPVGA